MRRRSLKCEHFERVQRKDVFRTSSQAHWRRTPLFTPRAAGEKLLRLSRRQFEGSAHVQRYALAPGARGTQWKNSFFLRPGCPAVDFKLARVTADPMRIPKHLRVTPRPVRSLRQHVPILLR